MKLIFTATTFLILAVAALGPQVNAQNRRRRTRPRHVTTIKSNNEEIDPSTPDERAKIAEECSMPDRARPDAAIKRPVLSGKAISYPKPSYPERARGTNASGTVIVDVVIDEWGRVIWAKAVSGHPLLQEVSVKAACRARYTPMKVSGRAVKVNSVITYNFVAP
jgi:TonB family protein